MAIKVSQAFERTSAQPIDSSIALTKAQMLTVNDNLMPAYYFTICQDDGKLYMYDKSATASLTTGKFTEFSGGDTSPFIYETTDTLDTTINGTVDVAYADITDINTANPTTEDLILGKTWVRDADGTVGVVIAVDDTNSEATIQTATTSGAGDSTAKYDYTTNVEVGGVPVGTEVKKEDLLADIVKQMLVKTYYPTYTAPSATLTYSANTYVEVGSTLAAATGVVAYNAGAITLQGTKQNDRGGAATKYYLSTTGADVEYSSDSTVSGTFSVSALTRATKGTIVITGKVDYAQGPQPKDSNGDNYQTPLPAGSVTATKTINFIQPFFYGKSSTFAVSTLAGLSKSVTAKGNKTFSFTTNNEFMVFAYDSSYGNLSSILDPNSFETISGWTKSTLTYNGFSYNVYVADSATTDTGAAYTFKF